MDGAVNASAKSTSHIAIQTSGLLLPAPLGNATAPHGRQNTFWRWGVAISPVSGSSVGSPRRNPRSIRCSARRSCGRRRCNRTPSRSSCPPARPPPAWRRRSCVVLYKSLHWVLHCVGVFVVAASAHNYRTSIVWQFPEYVCERQLEVLGNLPHPIHGAAFFDMGAEKNHGSSLCEPNRAACETVRLSLP